MVYDMSIRFALPQILRTAIDLAAADWHSNLKIERFWQKDPSLWTRDGEEKWMGWLTLSNASRKTLAPLPR